TYAESVAEDVKADQASLGSHKHPTSRPMIWFRTAWIQFSLNSVFGFDSDKLHFFKIGWFPFKLGRGISYGSSYGSSKDYLGVYSRAEDKYAAGILLDGELIKDKLLYNLYYSKIEESGSSIWDTYNTNKINQTDRRTNPWSGVAKDVDLLAAQFVWTPFNNEKIGKLNLQPYGLYLDASDQKVEFKDDATVLLCTFGLNLEYKKNGFEFGAEAAINTGYERLYPIDRNIVELKRWDHNGSSNPDIWGSNKDSAFDSANANIHNQGLLRETYNKVTVNANNISAPLNAGSENYVMESRYDGTKRNDGTYTDATDRFRPLIEHDLCGFFALADTSYLIKPWNLRIALAYAYASGDSNPHETEKNTRYNDFIGINEWYAGKRVPSVFLLSEKIIPQPLSLTSDTKKVYVDDHFSNLQSIGFGLNWKPKITSSKKVRINPNALFFWRTSGSLKYDVTKAKDGAPEYRENFSKGVVPNSEASKYLGTELNIIMETKPLPDLMFYATLAAFIPGGFYKDIKGVPLYGYPNVFSSLDAQTRGQVNLADYRLGDDTAYFMDIGIKYEF
ncbi:MAG: hypothetical protein ABIA74_00440, partial [bacterium]